MVVLVAGSLFLHTPVQVLHVKGNGGSDPRKLVVIKKNDAALTQQPTEVEEIDKHAVEPMVPVHEREIKAALLPEERRQRGLRHLCVKLHQRPDARLLEYLKSAVGK